MITNLHIAIFLFSTTCCFSQNKLRGRILDAETLEPVGFVNLGIIGKNTGTVSNVHGFFELSLDDHQFDDDSIRISSIGYESITRKVVDFKNELLEQEQKILLQPELRMLQEVVIDSKPFKTKILGNRTKSKLMRARIGSNSLGSELGLRIKVKKSLTFLERFQCHILENSFDSITFRLNIYEIGEDGLPKKNLLKDNILVKTAIKKGDLIVDLAPYNLVMEKDFIITLEWIERYLENELGFLDFPLGVLNASLIGRKASQANWIKYKGIGVGFSVEVKQ